MMGYGMSAKVTRLKLDTTQPYIPATMDDIRQVVVYTQSEELPLADDVPYNMPVQGDSIWVAGDIKEYKGLEGRMIVVRGEKDDTPSQVYNEPAVVSDATSDFEHSGQTCLQLKSGLGNSYKPGTVTINGNVVQATQGETIGDEILGSGDASQPYQSFTLRQSPLTYVQAPDSVTGTASTLEVRVDGIPWKEVDKLSGHGPRERIYTTSIGDDGTVTVQFGDGLSAGSRLPTGDDNVHATYRKGIGQQALVNAGQLSILMTRPLGVKGVSNPFDATGAIDPETIEDARSNADNTVLTLGRIVSIEDYKSYALSYTHVAKAQAKKYWNGSTWSMVVTIAGPTTPDMPYGTKIEEGDGYYERIQNDIYTWSDPTVPFVLQSYDPDRDLLLFRIPVIYFPLLHEMAVALSQGGTSHWVSKPLPAAAVACTMPSSSTTASRTTGLVITSDS